jgi:hypothetical protein
MSFGDAWAGELSAFGCGLADPAEIDCSATEVVDSHGQMMAREATMTNSIRIPASLLTRQHG